MHMCAGAVTAPTNCSWGCYLPHLPVAGFQYLLACFDSVVREQLHSASPFLQGRQPDRLP